MNFKKSFIFIVAMTVINLGAAETMNPNQCFTPQEVTQQVHNEIEKNGTTITPKIRETIEATTQKIVDNYDNDCVIFSGSGITGISLCVDPNLAFFYNRQNPMFDITYKSEDGKYKVKRFYASIRSIGLKAALAFNFNLIFLINTAPDFYEQNSIIELGEGADVTVPLPLFLPEVVYAPFRHIPGAILIVQVPAGINLGSLSLVIGGKIKGVDFPLKKN